MPKAFHRVCFLFLNSTTLRSCVKIYNAVWSGQVGPFATGQVGPLEKQLYLLEHFIVETKNYIIR